MNGTNPVDALFASARSHRIPMSQICERAGVATTTPSRWKHGRNGATIDALLKLEAALSEILAEDRAA